MTIAGAVEILVMVARGKEENELVILAGAWGGISDEGGLFGNLCTLIGLMGLFESSLGLSPIIACVWPNY